MFQEPTRHSMSRLMMRNNTPFFFRHDLITFQSTNNSIRRFFKIVKRYRFGLSSCRNNCCLIAYIGYIGSRKTRCQSRQPTRHVLNIILQCDTFQMYLEYFFPTLQVGLIDGYLSIKPSGTGQCLIQHIHSIGGGEHDHSRRG